MYYDPSEVVLMPVELLMELNSLDSDGGFRAGRWQSETMRQVITRKSREHRYDFTGLADAIWDYGFDPVHVCERTLTLTDGHHRLALAVRDGVAWLPCIYRDGPRRMYDVDYDDFEFYL